MIVQKRTYRKKRAQRYVEKKEGIRQMVYVTGDTHGEWERFKSKEMRKLRAGDTLVICGDNDPYLDYELVDSVLDQLPEGSVYEKISGASHVAYIEAPYYQDFQNRLVKFLND